MQQIPFRCCVEPQLTKILYAINPAKISLAETPFPNAGKQLFGEDITKIAAENADIVRNLQKNLNQQYPQTSSWSKPQLKKYQSKNQHFRPTPFAPNRYPHQAKGRFQFQQQSFRGKQNNSSH
jgi:hypothetical protein